MLAFEAIPLPVSPGATVQKDEAVAGDGGGCSLLDGDAAESGDGDTWVDRVLVVSSDIVTDVAAGAAGS